MDVQFFFLLVTALLSCAASEDGVSVKILASAGESVILPCRTDVSGDFPTVEWSKESLERGIAFLYRDGCETHEMKNLVFRYRTNLFMNELMKGNISLRISSLRLSDTGTYICKTILKKAQKVFKVELFVGAVSEPRLSVVPAVGGGGGVTLQCEANCWFPEPEVTFLDHQGNSISTEDPKSNLDSRGCFTVTSRLTVQADTNRRICRVHQPQINQTRETDIYIPADCMKSCTLTTSIAVVVTVIVCALTAFLCKTYGNSGKSVTLVHVK
ncbi:butyrophilin-like protein 9 isoform X2 [Morone saxatilis]|uniref:butyrophilin-like protein 9 isoform X2 n=1 Tax=Morone saxatilis TaxID=34816 RepID=UPI0015E24B58|nr:butyrophilin-like protein 9 isoform X2 [Morone saxatilis]